MPNEHDLTQHEKEDFWLEIGPPSAYTGLESHDTALENGDASPDAKRLGWEGAQPGQEQDSLPEDGEQLFPIEPGALDALEESETDPSAGL